MTAEAAAALLGTSTKNLGVWEERFGFPVPVRSDDGQRLYPDEMMIALRIALGRTFSVASAITEARRCHPRRPRTLSGQAGSRERFGRRLEKPKEVE